MNFTLIVTHGRSGSTLLQGILNAIDGWHIKGENHNFIYGLHQSYQALAKSSAMKLKGDPSSPTSPWFGIKDYDLEGYRQQICLLIKNNLVAGQYTETIVNTGFKEIRYFDLFKEDSSGVILSGYLDFLLKTLKPCKLVFLQRDLDDVVKSAWWAEEDRESTQKHLFNFNKFLLNYSLKNKENTFCIDYESIVSKGEKLNQLFSFLGVAPTEAKLNKVLMTNHSYKTLSVIPFSVPQSNKNHPKILLEADQLHVNKKFEQANIKYNEFIDQYEQGKFDRLPFYASVRANRQAYIVRSSHEHKIAYFPIPKCACSSISQLLYQVINNKSFTEDTTDDASVNIHRYFNSGSSELSLKKYNDYFKFTVIRDPIERFVSGYRNRILHHGDLDPVLQSMHIFTRPDINEFAMNLEDYILRSSSVDNHFRPINLRLSDSLNIFDAVIPIEEIKSVPSILANKTGQELQLPHVQTGGARMSVDDLTDASIEKLISFYKKDYELLSNYYSPDRIRRSAIKKPIFEMNFSMNTPFSK